MDIRVRWAARSVILKRWLAAGSVHQNESICELDIDGVTETVLFRTDYPGDDPCGIRFVYVHPGNEVGPFGRLFEYFTSSSGTRRDTDPVDHTTARARYVRRERFPRLFLSYRRDDTEAYAGRLHESLGSLFGSDEIFMDQFSIRPGEQFEWTVQQAAAHCDAMVVLIGPKWLSMSDELGKPRILSAWDLCHREICAALDRGVPVVPVLVGNASVPERSGLPDDLDGLQSLQCLTVTTRHWQEDVKELVIELQRQLAAK